MAVHPQSQAILADLERTDAPAAYQVPIWAARQQAAVEVAAANANPEHVTGTTDFAIPALDRVIPARLYRACRPPCGTIVYFHGGGFATGSIATYDGFLRRLANRTGWAVLAVEYRLAPEHPFPAAVEDAEVAFLWAWQMWGVDGPVVVAGDSAGGTLSTAVCRRLRDHGVIQPGGQVLIYPVIDPWHDTPSGRRYAQGYGLTRAHMDWYRSMYLADPADAWHPDAYPRSAMHLHHLPPALVIVAECDLLCDEGEQYARRLERHDVAVTLRRYAGQIHGFIAQPSVDDSEDALAQIGTFLRRKGEHHDSH